MMVSVGPAVADNVWQPFIPLGSGQFSLHATSGKIIQKDLDEPLKALVPNESGNLEHADLWRYPLIHGAAAKDYMALRGIFSDGTPVRILVGPLGIRHSVISKVGILRWSGEAAKNTVTISAEDNESNFVCETEEDEHKDHSIVALPFASKNQGVGDEVSLRTYLIIAAATGERTRWHGSKDATFFALAQLINEANAFLETEATFNLQLTSDSMDFIYEDPNSDPFLDSDSTQIIRASATLFGVDRQYDVGHVFKLSGGGRAAVGVFCGSKTPTCDWFWGGCGSVSAGSATSGLSLWTFLHEIGHQLGSRHTFSSTFGVCGPQLGRTVEPGSGSTILSYAGGCAPENLPALWQFHGYSLQRFRYQLDFFGEACGLDATTPVRRPRVVAQHTIRAAVPEGTPVVFRGASIPGSGGELTYSWEQIEGAAFITSKLPKSDTAVRYLPSLAVIEGAEPTFADRFPATGDATALLTVREQGALFGVTQQASLPFTVHRSAGRFRTLQPTGSQALTPGSEFEVIWDPAGTQLPPISCSEVDIRLSTGTEGSPTWPLAKSLPNSGRASITVPNVSVPAGRIWVECSSAPFGSPSPGTVSIAGTNEAVLAEVYPRRVPTCPGDTSRIAVVTHGSPDRMLSIRTDGPESVTTSTAPAEQIEAGSHAIVDVVLASAEPGSVIPIEISVGSDTQTSAFVSRLEVPDGIRAELISPDDGAIGRRGSSTFKVSIPQKAEAFRFEFSDDPDFANLIHRYPEPPYRAALPAGEYEFNIEEVLPQNVGGQIFWRFLGENSCGVTTASDSRHLCIGSAPDPIGFRIEPFDAVQRGPTVLLRPGAEEGVWHWGSGSTHVFEISNDETFEKILYRVGDHVDEAEPPLQPSSFPLQLEPGKTFFVRERVKADCGESVTSPVPVQIEEGFCATETVLTFNDNGYAVLGLEIESDLRIVEGGIEVEIDFQHPQVGSITATLSQDGTNLLQLPGASYGLYFDCELGRARLLGSQVANRASWEWDRNWQYRSCPNTNPDTFELIRVYDLMPSNGRRLGGRWEMVFSGITPDIDLDSLKVDRFCLHVNTKPAPVEIFNDGFEITWPWVLSK